MVLEESTGVSFPQSIKESGDVFVGLGIRAKSFGFFSVNVYVAAVYVDLPAAHEALASFRSRSVEQLVKDSKFYDSIVEGQFRVTIKFIFVRALSSSQLNSGFGDALLPRLSDKGLAKDFVRDLVDVAAGDEYTITVLASGHIHSRQGKDGPRREFPPSEISNAILACYLDESPVSPSLKAAVGRGLAEALHRPAPLCPVSSAPAPIPLSEGDERNRVDVGAGGDVHGLGGDGSHGLGATSDGGDADSGIGIGAGLGGDRDGGDGDRSRVGGGRPPSPKKAGVSFSELSRTERTPTPPSKPPVLSFQTLKGYLNKYNANAVLRNKWNKRWFELRLSTLSYALSAKEPVRGTLQLEECLITDCEKTGVGSLQFYECTISLPGAEPSDTKRFFRIACPSKRIIRRWVAGLRHNKKVAMAVTSKQESPRATGQLQRPPLANAELEEDRDIISPPPATPNQTTTSPHRADNAGTPNQTTTLNPSTTGTDHTTDQTPPSRLSSTPVTSQSLPPAPIPTKAAVKNVATKVGLLRTLKGVSGLLAFLVLLLGLWRARKRLGL